jgi:hypothetical protein
MHKSLRVALVAFIVGFTMLLHTPKVFAEQALTTVICADPDGNEITNEIGWDNSNQFFEGKGYIPRLYCEGGFAGPYTTYISDTLPADSQLGYYAGIVPTPSPTPEPSETIEPTTEPTPLPSFEPTLEPLPTPIPEPSIEPTPELTQTPEPLPTPTPTPPSLEPAEPTAQPSEPTPTQTPQTTPEPQPEPTPTPSETIAEPLPTPSLAPIPMPSLEPQEVTLEVPTQLMAIPGIEELAKAAEAIMNIGSDMTPEQREESQSVVIGAVLVSQIAASIRKVK